MLILIIQGMSIEIYRYTCNFCFKIHITILTCEYHNSTKPNLRKGDSKNQPPKYPNLAVGSWAISR